MLVVFDTILFKEDVQRKGVQEKKCIESALKKVFFLKWVIAILVILIFNEYYGRKSKLRRNNNVGAFFHLGGMVFLSIALVIAVYFVYTGKA